MDTGVELGQLLANLGAFGETHRGHLRHRRFVLAFGVY
jgi:hypothetical protein